MENESFERALEPQPVKRKRSSILKPAEKRVSRDSRTVSFSHRCSYKEYMDLTMMEVVSPIAVDYHNQTLNSNMDISMEQASITRSNHNNSTLENNNVTLTEDNMIEESCQQQMPSCPKTKETINESSHMDISLISQFIDTMPKVNNIDLPSVSYDTSTIWQKKMSLASSMDITPEASSEDDTLANGTFFGAFHDSNNISGASGVDTLVHNIEALNECILKVDQEVEDFRRRLDEEIEELFKFYRHIVSKENKYEFAISILGIRHSIWLMIKINPDTYPNEKLNLRFAVNKRDRHLYPFPEFAEAVRRCTKEGRHGYLTRFVINAQKFRRFLRCIGYRKPNE